MTTLPKRKVGKTNLEVTTLGLGGAPMGGFRAAISDAEATALKVVSNAFGHEQAEVELCRLVESAVQAAVVDRRLLGDGAHERDQRFPQCRKQAAYRRRRHAFIGAVDQTGEGVTIISRAFPLATT